MSEAGRPVPVPDERLARVLGRRRRALPRRSPAAHAAAKLSHPPDAVCPHCGSIDPAFEFTPVDGSGSVRSWTVMRQSFLPGFEVPFVLVDVELLGTSGPASHRPAGRRPRRTTASRRARPRGVRGRRSRCGRPGLRAHRWLMSGRMASSNQVAIVGYAQSRLQRHAETTLGALTVETARRAILDAGLTHRTDWTGS